MSISLFVPSLQLVTASRPLNPCLSSLRRASLPSTHHAANRRVQKVPTSTPPSMVSPLTLTTELLSLSLFAVVAYNLLNSTRSSNKKTDVQPASSSPSSSVTSTATATVTSASIDTAQVSPAFFSVASPIIAPTSTATPATPYSSQRPRSKQIIPQSGDIDTVGVNIPSYPYSAPNTQPQPQEELASTSTIITRQLEWAVQELVDIEDCSAAFVIDTTESSNTILTSHGNESILSFCSDDQQQLKEMPSKASSTSASTKVCNLSNAQTKQFTTEDGNAIKSIAYTPIGQTKLTAVMISPIEDFLGPREMRLVTAVCHKLSNIIS